MANDQRLTMVPFLLVGNSQNYINCVNKKLYSGYAVSSQIIIKFIKERN